MRLYKVTAVVLVFTLATPAFAARNGELPKLYDRITKIFQRLVHVIVPNGNGLIPPIPDPNP